MARKQYHWDKHHEYYWTIQNKKQGHRISRSFFNAKQAMAYSKKHNLREKQGHLRVRVGIRDIPIGYYGVSSKKFMRGVF